MYVFGGHRTPASTRGLARPLFALMALLIAGSGCASVGPAYRRPDVPVPAAWNGGAAADNAATAETAGDLSRWWGRLGDATLTGLIEQALAGSTDLRVVQAKLREARARRDLAGADRFPTVTASASVRRSKDSAESGAGGTNTLYNAGIDASWEPDIFGGTRRAAEGAQADLETSEANLRNTQVSLAAEVALNSVVSLLIAGSPSPEATSQASPKRPSSPTGARRRALSPRWTWSSPGPTANRRARRSLP